MGTRGLYGLRKNNKDKTTYNHWDSDPLGLGAEIIEFIKRHSTEELNSIYDNIVLVGEDTEPTKKEISECEKCLNKKLNYKDWYYILNETQGNLEFYANDLKYMIDNSDFILDSVFCEYAYIINLDTNKLEFWKGFQEKRNGENRYGTEKNNGYYPCKLKKEYDLEDLRNQETQKIIDEMESTKWDRD